MAQSPDSGIKKITLPQGEIGAMYADASTIEGGSPNVNKYFVRYRIVSEDGTMNSKWSQIHSIDAATFSGNSFGDGYTVVSNGTSMTVSWKLDSNTYGPSFDAYARYNSSAVRPDENDEGWSEWIFVSETSLSSFSTEIQSGSKWVQFYLQRKTFPKIKSDAAGVFETIIYPTRSTTDGGLLTQQ